MLDLKLFKVASVIVMFAVVMLSVLSTVVTSVVDTLRTYVVASSDCSILLTVSKLFLFTSYMYRHYVIVLFLCADLLLCYICTVACSC